MTRFGEVLLERIFQCWNLNAHFCQYRNLRQMKEDWSLGIQKNLIFLNRSKPAENKEESDRCCQSEIRITDYCHPTSANQTLVLFHKLWYNYLFLLNRSKLANIREEWLGREGGKLGEGVEASGFLKRGFIKNVFKNLLQDLLIFPIFKSSYCDWQTMLPLH